MKYENQKTKLIMQKKIEENRWRKIGICSSIKTKKIDNYIKKMCQEFKNEDFPQTDFFIKSEEDDIRYLIKCDAVILVEKYTETKYKDFNEMVKLLQEIGLPIVGVIIV